MNKYAYKAEIEHITKQIDRIKRIDAVNNKLFEYNWVFLHPYNQGFEITYFENILIDSNPNDIEKLIFERFAKKFLDLKYTVSMLETYYKRVPFIMDFSAEIEESIIFCLQKDYSGAITRLIPIIEGSLRNFLVSKKGQKAKEIIDISELTKAFNYMIEDYVTLQKEWINNDNNFDVNQKKQILLKYREYYTLWIKQLKDYLVNNLYQNTKGVSILKDNFNRHSIFHGFGGAEFNLNNYLRLLNCLNFFCWAIMQIDMKTYMMEDVEDDIIMKKWIEYYKVLIISESMDNLKSKIFNRKIESFKDYIEKPLLKPIQICGIGVDFILKSTERIIKK